MYEQLYFALRKRILHGELAPGSRLASTRAFAAGLGVSRFTVVSAMERLFAEGYLTAHRGAGTFVVDTLPEQMMRPARDGRARLTADEPSTLPTLSRRGLALSAVVITGPRSERDEPRPFHPRRTPLDVFPLRNWGRLIRSQWDEHHRQQLDYGEPAGYHPLRDAIAQHVVVTRGVHCSAQQVVVTSGSQQAFDILFRLLLDPGDKVWIEEPGCLDVRGALIGAGVTLVPIPVDECGIDVSEGMRRAPEARLAVVSPSHQYPTGATLSATRRLAILEWAGRGGSWIVEDDYDSYFRYRGRPMSALQGLDSGVSNSERSSPRVVYVGTFSKTMFPSLRLGFCVVPESLVDAVANARAVAGRNSPIDAQAALAEFIVDGHYDRHLRRVRLVCQERYEAMCFHFARVLGGVVSLSPASAGTHVLGWVHDEPRAGDHESFVASVSRIASEDDLVVFRLSRYCLEPPARDAFVLGYGSLSPHRIAVGVERLARSIERARRRL